VARALISTGPTSRLGLGTGLGAFCAMRALITSSPHSRHRSGYRAGSDGRNRVKAGQRPREIPPAGKSRVPRDPHTASVSSGDWTAADDRRSTNPTTTDTAAVNTTMIVVLTFLTARPPSVRPVARVVVKLLRHQAGSAQCVCLAVTAGAPPRHNNRVRVRKKSGEGPNHLEEIS